MINPYCFAPTFSRLSCHQSSSHRAAFATSNSSPPVRRSTPQDTAMLFELPPDCVWTETAAPHEQRTMRLQDYPPDVFLGMGELTFNGVVPPVSCLIEGWRRSSGNHAPSVRYLRM